MCVICCSSKNVRQPEEKTLKTMFETNPHGAGYMYAKDGVVVIKKGFLTYSEFIHNVRQEKFTALDSVVYHFRISTQAGKTAEMCQPFPLTKDITKTKLLDVTCPIGIAHNGIISITTDARERVYSDTAIYIADVLSLLIRSTKDMTRSEVAKAIEITTEHHNRFALMNGDGKIITLGDGWINDGGLLYSNGSYARNINNWFNID